jgi:hypothetical protein
MGFIHIDWVYFVYIMSSCLRCYSVCHELNTIDACWIAVDWWSNSSRCRQESVYLSLTWCLYTWSLPWIRHNYVLFYQLPNSNLSTHRMLWVRERSLRVYFKHIKKPKNTLLHFIYFSFVLQFILLPIQDLILASNEFKGIDNPRAHDGCKYLLSCVQVLFMRICVILLLVQ